MKLMKQYIILFIAFLSLTSFQGKDSGKQKDVDVCVYGGTASGVIAAYSAKMMGKSVVLNEPGKYL